MRELPWYGDLVVPLPRNDKCLNGAIGNYWREKADTHMSRRLLWVGARPHDEILPLKKVNRGFHVGSTGVIQESDLSV